MSYRQLLPVTASLCIALALWMTGTSVAQAQRERRADSPPPVENVAGKHQQVYRMALEYADYSAAILALYYWIAEEPDNLALKDSLATLYFSTGANTQAVLIGQEILRQQPDNRKNLEMVAIAYNRMGLLKQSLENYEPLYRLTQNPRHLYQISVLEYKLQRLGECELHARELAAHPRAAEEMVGITTGENQTEQVKLNAAALNILGVLAKEKGRKEDARTLFQQAAEADPQYSLPKSNLRELDKP